MTSGILVSIAVLILNANAASPQQPQAQPCVADSAPTAEQTARRRQGVQLARTVHNAQVNQPGARERKYLAQTELATSPFAARQTGAAAEFFKSLNFTPGAELLPGWAFTLDVTADGYWFSLKDKTDPCGFTFVSNHEGIIFQARPIR